MPKWKKGETRFTVGVNHHIKRGYQACIPKPIVKLLSNPKKMTFVIEGNKILVKSI